MWLRYSFASSPILTSFLQILQDRVEYIREVIGEKSINNPNESLRSIWLPGFFDQGNLLSMLLQQEARKRKISVDELTFNFNLVEE